VPNAISDGEHGRGSAGSSGARPLGAPPHRRSLVLAVAAGLVATIAVAYHRVLFLAETFAARDNLTLILPGRQFLAESLRADRLPEWSDWIALGVPFAANPINGVAYPPFWLAALGRSGVASDLIILLHLAIAALGAAALARRLGANGWGAWFAGAAFVTCGYVSSMPANNNAHLLCWVPWVAWAADRVARPAAGEGFPARLGASALLAGAFGLQLVVGEPAHVVASALLALLVVAARSERRGRDLARAALALAAGVPLAAASLLPGLAVLSWTSRAAASGAENAAWWLAPQRLVELLWPGVLGPQVGPGSLSANLARGLADTFGMSGRLNGPSWSFSVFVGIPVLACCLWALRGGARPARWMAVGSLVFVVLAFGAATPVYPALAALLPPLGLLRYPEKLLLPALVVWTAWAGAGFGRLVASGPDRWLVRACWTGTAALAVALAVGAALGGEIGAAASARTQGSLFPVDGAAGVAYALRSGAVALGVSLAFAVLVASSAGRRGRALPLAAGLVAIGHGAWVSAQSNPTVPREALAPPALLAPLVPERPLPARPRLAVEDRRPPWADYRTGAEQGEYVLRGASGNVPALFGLDAYPGTYSFEQRALLDLRRAQQAELDRRFVPLASRYTLVGAEAVVVSIEFAPLFALPVLSTDRWVGSSLLGIPQTRPRAFVAPRWRHSDLPVAEIVRADPLDLGRVVFGGRGDASPEDAATLPLTPCDLRSERPEHVDLTCASASGGYAVVLDAAAPGWSAEVDGVPAPLEAADTVFRAVRVGPGEHRIAMRYRTPWLRAGAAIALAAWIAWGAVVLVAARAPASPRAGAS
jgi:hypothetical protein